MAPQTCHVSVLARCFKPEGPETLPTARFPDSEPVFTGRQFGSAFRHQCPHRWSRDLQPLGRFLQSDDCSREVQNKREISLTGLFQNANQFLA